MLTALVRRDLLLPSFFALIGVRSDDDQPIENALNFFKGAPQDRPGYRCQKPFEAFGNRLQMRLEAPNTEPWQTWFFRALISFVYSLSSFLRSL